MSVNINPDTTSVNITAASNTVTIVDAANNVNVTTSQPVTQVVTVAIPGPQGIPGSFPSTGSFSTTGSNSFIGNQVITGSLIVSGSSTFTNIGPTILSGSVVSTQGFTGSFIGEGSGLYNIPASGIVGLNLSQISSGSVSASISSETGLQVNTNVTATSFTGSFSGSGADLFNIPASGIIGLNLSQISSGSVSASISPDNGLQVNTDITAPSFTGSLFGTSSWAEDSISSSFASTASLAPNYLPLTGGTISGSLTVTNNLAVLGSASIQYISESVLNIGTNLITVNTINPGARFGGLAVIDSGSSPIVSASFLYDSVQDEFIFVHRGTSTSAITSSHFLLGPETYNDLGNEIYLTANRIPKGTGIEHLNDSNISDDGSIVSINSNTEVTGSLTATSFTGSLFGTASYALSSNIPPPNIRRNFQSGSINYAGYAPSGSLESDSVWTITKITVATDGSVTTITNNNVTWTSVPF